MRSSRDPEHAELSHLINACQLEGKDILEIGCGDGKFIRQYTQFPRKITGIDPEVEDLITAVQSDSKNNIRVRYLQAEGEHLPFTAHASDIAIFASSL
jgi:ubiquinone/menaquinone biosynthesis C-methylase UbiE